MERNRLLKKAIISFEEYERLVKDGVQKDILEQRINKAIEWVNNHIETYTQNGIGIIDWNYDADPRKLLEILKGSDKE